MSDGTLDLLLGRIHDTIWIGMLLVRVGAGLQESIEGASGIGPNT